MTRTLTFLLLAASAGATFAQSTDTTPRTREQVIAEIAPARADGSFYAAGDGTPRGLARARLAERESRERDERLARSASTGRTAQ